VFSDLVDAGRCRSVSAALRRFDVRYNAGAAILLQDYFAVQATRLAVLQSAACVVALMRLGTYHADLESTGPLFQREQSHARYD